LDNFKFEASNLKFLSYPWRCLCLGLVQITLTTPLRWIILQLSHIFLTEARTFIYLPSPFEMLRLENPLGDYL
jgi:hypothetical protein